MKAIRLFTIAVAGLASMASAQAVFDRDAFINAVRDRDGDKAHELLESRGEAIVNLKDGRGDTPLIVAVSRRDDSWTGFLLNKGADPNVAGRGGETPLIAAARVGYEIGAQWLVSKGAKIDQANARGETPLIVAVQQRQVPLVKYLLGKGANPDKPDSAAGYSARDYAKRDSRTPEMLRLIEARKNEAAKAAIIR